ncbi:MAG: hypothetical protein KGL39_13360 [Patescibacteria group bacterium]|nr:hypothetical protein [Patescibacteria group bacterium]
MKKLTLILSAVLCLLTSGLRATIVHYSAQTFFSPSVTTPQAQTNSFTLQPLIGFTYTVLGTNLIWGAASTVYPDTNGQALFTLLPNSYRMTPNGSTFALIVNVPNNSVTNELVNLISTGAGTYTWTNNVNGKILLESSDTVPDFLLNKMQFANATYVTNNPGADETVTVTIAGTGGGGSGQATNFVGQINPTNAAPNTAFTTSNQTFTASNTFINALILSNGFSTGGYSVSIATNAVYLAGFGSSAANGIFYQTSSTVWTNTTTAASLQFAGGVYNCLNSAGQTLYTSATLINSTWTVGVSGSSPAGSSSFCAYDAGAHFIGGVVVGTNITFTGGTFATATLSAPTITAGTFTGSHMDTITSSTSGNTVTIFSGLILNLGTWIGAWATNGTLSYTNFGTALWSFDPSANFYNSGNITTVGTNTSGYFNGNGGGVSNVPASAVVGTLTNNTSGTAARAGIATNAPTGAGVADTNFVSSSIMQASSYFSNDVFMSWANATNGPWPVTWTSDSGHQFQIPQTAIQNVMVTNGAFGAQTGVATTNTTANSQFMVAAAIGAQPFDVIGMNFTVDTWPTTDNYHTNLNQELITFVVSPSVMVSNHVEGLAVPAWLHMHFYLTGYPAGGFAPTGGAQIQSKIEFETNGLNAMATYEKDYYYTNSADTVAGQIPRFANGTVHNLEFIRQQSNTILEVFDGTTVLSCVTTNVANFWGNGTAWWEFTTGGGNQNGNAANDSMRIRILNCYTKSFSRHASAQTTDPYNFTNTQFSVSGDSVTLHPAVSGTINSVNGGTSLLNTPTVTGLHNGLIFDEPLSEGYGTTTTNFYGYNGTLVGNATWAPSPFGGGHLVYTYNQGTYPVVAGYPPPTYIGTWSPNLIGATNLSISVLFKCASITNYSPATPVLIQNGTSANAYYFYVNLRAESPNQIGIGMNNSFLGGINAPNFQDGALHQAVMSWDGANIKVYLDGAYQGSIAYTTAIQNEGSYGSATYGLIQTGCFENGWIGETCIWNRPLSSNEVAQAWQLTQGGYSLVNAQNGFNSQSPLSGVLSQTAGQWNAWTNTNPCAVMLYVQSATNLALFDNQGTNEFSGVQLTNGLGIMLPYRVQVNGYVTNGGLNAKLHGW